MNCPTCGSNNTVERGRGPEVMGVPAFIRFRCRDCTSEFGKVEEDHSNSLGACTVCGEMVNKDDGEDMATKAGAEGEYQHFDCDPDAPPAPYYD